MEDFFHYPPVLQELSEAMRHVMQASDWLERATIVQGDREQRQRQEYGNVIQALTRLKNAYLALSKRHDEMTIAIRLEEKPIMDRVADLEQVVRETPTAHLPPELQHPDAIE